MVFYFFSHDFLRIVSQAVQCAKSECQGVKECTQELDYGKYRTDRDCNFTFDFLNLKVLSVIHRVLDLYHRLHIESDSMCNHTSYKKRFSENFDEKVVTYLIFFVGTLWFQKCIFWKKYLSPFWGRRGQRRSMVKEQDFDAEKNQIIRKKLVRNPRSDGDLCEKGDKSPKKK